MQAKKSLGQNFLRSDKAIREIIGAGELVKTDIVLEIGPGEGVLTEKLLASGAKVIAIEKDDRLVIPLSTRFQSQIKSGQFVLIHGDILDFVYKNGDFIEMSPDLAELLKATQETSLLKNPSKNPPCYKLIANIPYYITGEIIERFHTVVNNPSLMVLLVQKEVAERITAKPVKNDEFGKESILSIAVKMYGEPKMVSIVPRGAFHPAPNVDSAVFCIKNIKHFGTQKKEKEFFDLLHAAFAHKRKLMLSNIKIMPETIQKKVQTVLDKNKVVYTVRAEDIPIAIWKEMI